ncbi:unnamed protein product [Penicillium manginii]
MADQRTYNDNDLIQLYMGKITPQCREDRVDHMWTQILRYYFHVNEFYGIEREVYTTEIGRGRVDLMVTGIHLGEIYKTLFLEAKRPPAPSRNITRNSWDAMKSQLQANIDRWADRDLNVPVYGMTAVGLYVKFYVIPAHQTQLQPVMLTDRPYSLREESLRVDAILSNIKDSIKSSLQILPPADT